jgi:Domain of unknown function DUF11
MRTSMSRAALITTGLVMLFALSGGSAMSAPNAAVALPKADLLIMQAPDVLHASPGQLVTFTSYAANNGPSTSQLDAIVEGKVNLAVKRQECQKPPVSPDGFFCEFGSIAPGKTVRMQVTAKVTGDPGDHAALTVCTGSEGSTADPNPSNDCTTTAVRIT